MGASLTFQASAQRLNFMNSVTQESQQSCEFTQQASNSGQTIIITDSDISNATIGQSITLTTDASCLIASNMQDNIENILQATLSQGQYGEYGPLSSWGIVSDTTQLSRIKEKVTNNIYQISQATCGTSNIANNSNQYLYVKGSNAQGAFLGQSIDSNVNSSCSMNNYMKFSLYNLSQALSDLNATHKGGFGALGGIIAIVIVLIILLVVGFFVFSMMKKKRADAAACAPDPVTKLTDPRCVNGKLPANAKPLPKPQVAQQKSTNTQVSSPTQATQKA